MTADSEALPAATEWTVGKILGWTTQHLKKHGGESPRLEAEILLAHARNCPRIRLYTHYNDLVSDSERAAMRDLVRRRAQAEPVAYLVGYREFFGLNFRVTSDVLVPRPETEALVLDLVTLAKPCGNPLVLDLGTGSGCIAVAAAVHLSAAAVTAVDISPAALKIARGNAEQHHVASRVAFLDGDLFAPLATDARFDFIASNPPYVADHEIKTLPADVRLHEPHLALKAGPDGLDVIRRIVANARTYLKPGGWLLMEFSPEQAGAVCTLLQSSGDFDDIQVTKDASGNARIVKARAV